MHSFKNAPRGKNAKDGRIFQMFEKDFIIEQGGEEIIKNHRVITRDENIGEFLGRGTSGVVLEYFPNYPDRSHVRVLKLRKSHFNKNQGIAKSIGNH